MLPNSVSHCRAEPFKVLAAAPRPRKRVGSGLRSQIGPLAALAHVKSENAEASERADLDAIRALIKSYSGEFGTLNDTVKTHLRRWFVSQGGVQVAARHSRTAGRAHMAHPGRRPDRVEWVHVANFAASTRPVSGGDGGTNAITVPPVVDAGIIQRLPTAYGSVRGVGQTGLIRSFSPTSRLFLGNHSKYRDTILMYGMGSLG